MASGWGASSNDWSATSWKFGTPKLDSTDPEQIIKFLEEFEHFKAFKEEVQPPRGRVDVKLRNYVEPRLLKTIARTTYPDSTWLELEESEIRAYHETKLKQDHRTPLQRLMATL
jgi:hypothetical protein